VIAALALLSDEARKQTNLAAAMERNPGAYLKPPLTDMAGQLRVVQGLPSHVLGTPPAKYEKLSELIAARELALDLAGQYEAAHARLEALIDASRDKPGPEDASEALGLRKPTYAELVGRLHKSNEPNQERAKRLLEED
jgi:hypothetical protein